jgi:hypothetical protein
VIASILTAQSTDVSAVSGATYSSLRHGAFFTGDSRTRTNPHRDGFEKAGIPERLSENNVPHGSAELCFFAERL